MTLFEEILIAFGGNATLLIVLAFFCRLWNFWKFVKQSQSIRVNVKSPERFGRGDSSSAKCSEFLEVLMWNGSLSPIALDQEANRPAAEKCQRSRFGNAREIKFGH